MCLGTDIPDLRILIRPLDGGVEVHLAGDLTMASELELNDAVAPGTVPGGKLRVDLLRVDFVDSAGLSLLLTLHRRAIAEAFSLTLTRVPAHVARVFDVAGLDSELPWEAFEEEL